MMPPFLCLYMEYPEIRWGFYKANIELGEVCVSQRGMEVMSLERRRDCYAKSTSRGDLPAQKLDEDCKPRAPARLNSLTRRSHITSDKIGIKRARATVNGTCIRPPKFANMRRVPYC